VSSDKIPKISSEIRIKCLGAPSERLFPLSSVFLSSSCPIINTCCNLRKSQYVQTKALKTIIHPTQQDYDHRTKCSSSHLMIGCILSYYISSCLSPYGPIITQTNRPKNNQGLCRQQHECVLHSRKSNAVESNGHIEKW